jgi:hypothetical protein
VSIFTAECAVHVSIYYHDNKDNLNVYAYKFGFDKVRIQRYTVGGIALNIVLFWLAMLLFTTAYYVLILYM